MELRHINMNDAIFLHALRNDHEVRISSRNQSPISLERQRQWMRQAIEDPNTIATVIRHRNKRIGQLNLKRRTGMMCEVSISLMPEFRGNGYAAKALKIAHKMASDAGYRQVLAEVKKSNKASLGLFKGQLYEVYSSKKMVTLIKEV